MSLWFTVFCSAEVRQIVYQNEYFAGMFAKMLTFGNSRKGKPNVNIIVLTQKQFIQILKDANLWHVIFNLEQRNYPKTAYLVKKHEDQAPAPIHTSQTNSVD